MYKKILAILGGMLLIPNAFAQQAGVDTIFTNFVGQYSGLMSLVDMASMVMGFALVVISLFKLVEHNRSKGQLKLSTPISYFFTGIILISIGTMMDVMSYSTMGVGAGDPLMPSPTGNAAQFRQAFNGVVLFIRFVGVLAFIRGWLILMGHATGKQGATLGRGITFIVGGVMCYHSVFVAKLLASTFGMPIPF